jgi:putative peptidoglycan binding protein
MAEELEAITLEDEQPLEHVGEEADAPSDLGYGPAEEDLEAPADTGVGVEEDLEPPADTGIAAEKDTLVAPAPAGWRVAGCILALRREIDARWPNRDRRSDGTIGDQRHCGPGRPPSDHCPNAAGVVRALDVDSDGIAAAWLAEHVRSRGAAGDRRLANGGYVIFNRRIASWSHGWRWRAYTGSSPHTDHIHISVSRDAAGYDAPGAWGVRTGGGTGGPTVPTTPGELPEHPLGSRVLRLADPPMRGTDVAFVQRWVGAEDDGVFGQATEERVKRFQSIVGLQPDGVVGPLTWRAMRVG